MTYESSSADAVGAFAATSARNYRREVYLCLRAAGAFLKNAYDDVALAELAQSLLEPSRLMAAYLNASQINGVDYVTAFYQQQLSASTLQLARAYANVYTCLSENEAIFNQIQLPATSEPVQFVKTQKKLIKTEYASALTNAINALHENPRHFEDPKNELLHLKRMRDLLNEKSTITIPSTSPDLSAMKQELGNAYKMLMHTFVICMNLDLGYYTRTLKSHTESLDIDLDGIKAKLSAQKKLMTKLGAACRSLEPETSHSKAAKNAAPAKSQDTAKHRLLH